MDEYDAIRGEAIHRIKVLFGSEYFEEGSTGYGVNDEAVLCWENSDCIREFGIVDDDGFVWSEVDMFSMESGHDVYCVFQDPVLEESYVVLYVNRDEREWPEERCDIEESGGVFGYCTLMSGQVKEHAWVPLDGIGNVCVDVDWKNLRIGEGA